jgi:hypothetical protein
MVCYWLIRVWRWLVVEYVWVNLEKMLTESPFLFTVNVCWFIENKTVIWVHFHIMRMQISLWISANKRTFHIKVLIPTIKI